MIQDPPSPQVPRRDLLIVLVLSFLGLVLRVLYATRSGIWRDEALFLSVSRLPLGQMVDFLRLHESHPPLYYLMERGWEALWGRSDTAALALPVAIGVLTIPVAYAVGRAMFSRQAALLMTAVTACSPILAEHSGLIRPYSFLPLLTLLAGYALWRALLGARAAWAAYALLATTLLYTHNFSWLVLAAFGLTATAWLAFTRPPGALKTFGWLAAAHLGVLVLYAPWLPTFLYQATHAGHAPRNTFYWTWPFSMFVCVFMAVPSTALGAVMMVASLAVVGRTFLGTPNRGDRLAIWLFLVAPLLMLGFATTLSGRSQMLWPRTLLLMAPCLQLLVCEGIARALPKGWRIGPAFTGVALSGFYLAIGLGLLGLPKSDARELAAAVSQNLQPDDLVVVCPEWMAPSFNHYFPAAPRQIDYPADTREEITQFNDVAARIADPAALARTKAALQAQRRAGKRVWLVVQEDSILPGLPPGDAIPALVNPTHWNGVGSVRTTQVYRELQRLYGRPAKMVMLGGEANPSENLDARLYAPPGH